MRVGPHFDQCARGPTPKRCHLARPRSAAAEGSHALSLGDSAPRSGRGRCLLVSAGRDFLECGNQIAGEQPVAESFSQHPPGNLPGNGCRSRAAGILGARRNERPQSSLHVDIPFVLERSVRLLNRIRVDLQFARKFPDGGEGFVGFQNSHRHAAANFVHDLAVDGPRIGRVYVH